MTAWATDPWVAAAASPTAVALRPWNGSAAPQPETLTLTMPPASIATDEASTRSTGMADTITAAWWLLPGKADVPTRGVWYSHDGRGHNPGLDDPALTGIEMIEVPLPAGNRTAAQVASDTADTLNEYPEYTATSDGAELTITGLITASAWTAGPAWADRGGGGIIGCQSVTSLGDFAVTTGTVSQLIDMPAPGTRFRVHGFQIYWGSVHTGQIAVALYQGDTAADGTSTGATLVRHLGVTSGTATAQWVTVLLPAADQVTLDMADGRLFLARAGDSGSRHGAESLATQANARSWNFFRTGTGASSANVSWALAATGNITGSDATFPSTLPTQGSANAFGPAIRLLYTVEPWAGSGEWRARVGTRQPANGFTANIAIDFIVGLSFALPSVLGMRLSSIGAALAVHTTTGQPRVEAWAGGDAADDYTDATLLYSAPQMTGTATGFTDFDVPDIAVAESSRMWLTIKGLNSTSEVAYSPGGTGEYSPPLNPSGYLNVGSETENPEGQGIEIDGASPTASPLAPTTPPTNPNPQNYPALRATVRVPGFAVAA